MNFLKASKSPNNNRFRGKRHSEESKARIRANGTGIQHSYPLSRKGRILSAATLAKMSYAAKHRRLISNGTAA